MQLLPCFQESVTDLQGIGLRVGNTKTQGAELIFIDTFLNHGTNLRGNSGVACRVRLEKVAGCSGIAAARRLNEVVNRNPLDDFFPRPHLCLGPMAYWGYQ